MNGADPNQAVYEQRAIARQYATIGQLTAAEAAIFDRYREDYVGRTVLDLGVGGGRTTPWLAPQAASYIGLDYSRRMIETCRERFPQWRFQVGDARDLAEFADETIDFVLFSFNGIDYVDHAGRMQILRETGRVLRPGAVIAFSSHNLESLNGKDFARNIFTVDSITNPARAAKAAARVGLRLFNYARNARAQVRTQDYAILVDPAHDFVLRTYYIRPAAQQGQLVEAGFSPPAEVFDEHGNQPPAGATPYALYYVARKAQPGRPS
jgi:ubiquinone/menaquinone biosynthesis C-methylase UbiE